MAADNFGGHAHLAGFGELNNGITLEVEAGLPALSKRPRGSGGNDDQ